MDFKDLQNQVYILSVEKGFWDKKLNVLKEIALIHSELSEAVKEIETGRGLTEIYYDVNDKPLGFGIEIGDAMQRLMSLASEVGIDLEQAILMKHEYNKKRPYRHGKRV
jgi:NTP pyrophosphatase (non-canonical NTP hydrolase)